MQHTLIGRAALFVRCGQAMCGHDVQWKVAFGRLLGIKADTVDAMAKGQSRVPPGIWRDIRQHLRKRLAHLQEIGLLIQALDTEDSEEAAAMFGTTIFVSHANLGTTFFSPLHLAEANRRLAAKPEFEGAVIVPVEKGHEIHVPAALSEEAQSGIIDVFRYEIGRATKRTNEPCIAHCPDGITELAPFRFLGGPPLEGQSFQIMMSGDVMQNARIVLREDANRMVVQIEGAAEGWYLTLEGDALSNPCEERWLVGGREPVWRTPELLPRQGGGMSRVVASGPRRR